LKTGQLVGASPMRQQIALIILLYGWMLRRARAVR
jgi:uncharacterized oligopeptide transporter (OPT) family protein